MDTKTLILASGFAILGALASAQRADAVPAAPLQIGAMQLSGVEQAAHRKRYRAYRHYRPRITVYPREYYQPGFSHDYPDYSYYYPPVRGFDDPNNVPRGNMRGCTVDLGYGRYESCDK